MILDRIARAKREEVAGLKKRVPQKDLLQAAERAGAVRDFAAALRRGGMPAVIAEIKKGSPSAGIIRSRLDVAAIAASYERAGAAAISVITDKRFFFGSLDYLTQARAATSLPLLCKDFIIDAVQVLASRAAGADAILLIAALLDSNTLPALMDLAHSLGMACLVEVHDEKELAWVLKTEARIIGINNRNLQTFAVDLHTTKRLMPMISGERLVVSESGIQDHHDLASLAAMGVQAALVGTSLMRAEEPGDRLRELLGASRRAAPRTQIG
ncbi:MAG: indole-3-glycerol phosphate synthase TrpC [Deltaproteobacteria bacterium]|nr:indole-3-glycerol phosphate synthase TrpC [Deltaproteobacteria bacterium]MBW2071143.1 indole-3-glycerol phosphate synthase TrpC [Deltaproteobacteria bacterium]